MPTFFYCLLFYSRFVYSEWRIRCHKIVHLAENKISTPFKSCNATQNFCFGYLFLFWNRLSKFGERVSIQLFLPIAIIPTSNRNYGKILAKFAFIMWMKKSNDQFVRSRCVNIASILAKRLQLAQQTLNFICRVPGMKLYLLCLVSDSSISRKKME